MANTILVGAQWGDEGKGKIIDVLTEQADFVVRTQGGNNAGHTVFLGSKKYVLHLVPSGILRPRKTCVIGNGVVIDPVSLVDEIEGLIKLGVKVDGNLFISETTHLVLPYHRELGAHRPAHDRSDQSLAIRDAPAPEDQREQRYPQGLRRPAALVQKSPRRLSR